MGLALWLAAGAALVLALLGLALLDQSRARRASESLHSAAEEMGAMPIASMRNGAQIVFLRRDASTSDAPFVILRAGESQHVSAAEIRRLWNSGRLWWYHTGETPPLGLSYYLRYLDGHYASSCQCHLHDDSCAVGALGDHDESEHSHQREG
jgi:hypothetical protein